MRILIDIGHPAHVHMFRCFAHEMIKRGHQVLFTCRDKEFELNLLIAEQLDFISFGKKNKGLIGKIWDTLKFDVKEVFTAFKFKPDVFLSHGSISASHAAFLCRKPNITFEDTFNNEQIRLYEPFTDVIFTSDYEHPLNSKKVIKYQGYNELLYLHPNQFTPDATIYKELGLSANEKYAILRFVSWDATHDIGHSGMSTSNKIKAVNSFSKHAKVFISSESKLPAELELYRLPTKAERIHHVLSKASLVFGESATMVTEGIMLGVPGVYLDNTGRYYTRDIAEKYGLCFNYTESKDDQVLAINKGVEILSNTNDSLVWKNKTKRLLAEKIDATAFLTWFIENYPKSKEIINKDSNYQHKFK